MQSRVTTFITIAWAGWVCLLAGCGHPSTAREVQGHYTLQKREATVHLDLKEDMTFVETIHFPSSEVVTIRGNWDFQPKVYIVDLDGVANVAEKLDPHHIERIDTGKEAEKWFGKYRLDADVIHDLYFYKD